MLCLSFGLGGNGINSLEVWVCSKDMRFKYVNGQPGVKMNGHMTCSFDSRTFTIIPIGCLLVIVIQALPCILQPPDLHQFRPTQHQEQMKGSVRYTKSHFSHGQLASFSCTLPASRSTKQHVSLTYNKFGKHSLAPFFSCPLSSSDVYCHRPLSSSRRFLASSHLNSHPSWSW